MKILVTGATGKVGRSFIDRMLGDSEFPDCTVRAFCHNRVLPEQERLEIIKGSIASRADVKAALDGVTHVLHLATCKETPDDVMDVTVKGLFWLLELFYVPYILGAPWFNQSTYANLMRIGLPTLTWGGMAWGLGGLLMSKNGHPFPSGTSFMGISLLMALTVFGIPLNFRKRERRRGGPQPRQCVHPRGRSLPMHAVTAGGLHRRQQRWCTCDHRLQ